MKKKKTTYHTILHSIRCLRIFLSLSLSLSLGRFYSHQNHTKLRRSIQWTNVRVNCNTTVFVHYGCLCSTQNTMHTKKLARAMHDILYVQKSVETFTYTIHPVHSNSIVFLLRFLLLFDDRINRILLLTV